MSKLDGSCLCGKVTYRCAADPIATAVCHCTTCQKQTGTAFSVVVVVPREAFEVEGESLATYTTVSEDSGLEARRVFCRECGSPIATLADGMPSAAIIKAGTLDDRTWLEPQAHVFCDSALPFVAVDQQPGIKLPRGAPAPA